MKKLVLILCIMLFCSSVYAESMADKLHALMEEDDTETVALESEEETISSSNEDSDHDDGKWQGEYLQQYFSNKDCPNSIKSTSENSNLDPTTDFDMVSIVNYENYYQIVNALKEVNSTDFEMYDMEDSNYLLMYFNKEQINCSFSLFDFTEDEDCVTVVGNLTLIINTDDSNGCLITIPTTKPPETNVQFIPTEERYPVKEIDKEIVSTESEKTISYSNEDKIYNKHSDEEWSGEYLQQYFPNNDCPNTLDHDVDLSRWNLLDYSFNYVTIVDYANYCELINMLKEENHTNFETYDMEDLNYLIIYYNEERENCEYKLIDYTENNDGIIFAGDDSVTIDADDGMGFLITIPTTKPIGTKIECITGSQYRKESAMKQLDENYKILEIRGIKYVQYDGKEWEGDYIKNYHKHHYLSIDEILEISDENTKELVNELNNSIEKVMTYDEYMQFITDLSSIQSEKNFKTYDDRESNYIVLYMTCFENQRGDLTLYDVQTKPKEIIVCGHECREEATDETGVFITIPTQMPAGTHVQYIECYNEEEILKFSKKQEAVAADKPILYLYPETETDVTVELGKPELITCSYPKYKDKWKVHASPNGTLTEEGKDKELYALYYESKTDSIDIRDGFVVKSEDSASFLEEKLSLLGLTNREAEEFIVYWLPKLESNPYNLIHFATDEEINEYMPIEITPKPDNFIRVWMVFEALDEPIEIEEQKLVSPERNGFVAVEWGGIENKNSNNEKQQKN